MGFNGCAEQRGNTQCDIYVTAGELCASKYDVTLNSKIFSSRTMENAFFLLIQYLTTIVRQWKSFGHIWKREKHLNWISKPTRRDKWLNTSGLILFLYFSFYFDARCHWISAFIHLSSHCIYCSKKNILWNFNKKWTNYKTFSKRWELVYGCWHFVTWFPA